MSFPNRIWGSDGDQYLNSATKTLPFGTVMEFNDGRQFVYSQAGAVALAAGNIQQQSVVVSGHTKDLAVLTGALSATTVTFTNATTAITANMYAEGFMFTNNAAGEGYAYRIKSNLAESTGSGTATIVLEEGSALRVALTTSSKIGLRKHPLDETLVAPTTITGVVVGVAVMVVTINYYCWLQTKGVCAVLTNGTLVLGEPATRSATVAGAADPYNEDGTGNLQIVGMVQSVGSDTEFSLIDLNIK